LIDEFLIDDLGFSEKDMDIGVLRGPRIPRPHTGRARADPEKPERREIVDYILGTGLDSDLIFTRATKVVEGFKGQKTTGVWQIDGFDDGRPGFGWSRRVAGYVSDRLADIGRLDDKAAKRSLKSTISTPGRRARSSKYPEATWSWIRSGNRAGWK